MAAAYAALLSLFHTLNQIKTHPRPPISLDQSQVESLTHNLTFVQHFLERYPTYEDDELESRIVAAAYAAEDVIETRIVDQIQHATSTSDDGVDLYGDVERVIQDMDFIKRDVMEIMQQMMMMTPQDADLHSNSSSVSTLQSSTLPVFDEAIIIQVLDKLTGQQSALNIIPIVGMGGIGKTTFASNIYRNPLIVQYFDVRAWVTISQQYSRKHIFQLLCQELKVSKNVSSEMMEDEIGLVLYQHLCGRRYLIVMDDMWSIDAWDIVKSFFPDNNNGSRIMVTTRLSNLASELSGSHIFQMQFLHENKSWDLLCQTVFGKQDCPTELENIGKQIARKCRGLPLSLAVIGGLLRKSNMTQTYWKFTLENLSVIINLEKDEYTLRILGTSYKELPMHLKPCFLYMGIFLEDEEIRTSMLIRLWVAEGILRPVDDKSLEEVAKENLKELIDRNLILISRLRWDGEAKLCKMHDLLRDVCLREAQKQKFFCVLRQQGDHTPQDINMERRINVNLENAVKKYSPEFIHSMESASLTRSLLNTMHADSRMVNAAPSPRFRLLRVYSSVGIHDYNGSDSNNVISEQAYNLRYFFLKLCSRMPPIFSLLWNLQTLKVSNFYNSLHLTFNIWKKPLLRHVILEKFALPDPPNGEDKFVLENLQTLSGVINLKFSEEVVKRIPRIKRLKLLYPRAGLDDFCLHNLGRLQKLEDLTLIFNISFEVRKNLVSFPHSLKKLCLSGTELSWEELTIRIGSLPLLQGLRLGHDACRGHKWETVEGHFCSLRVLKIHECYDLQYWEMEDCTHFPRLEYLYLYDLPKLEEIPLNIGDIPTLKLIHISNCSKSATDSVERIKEEQDENGNEDLQVIIDVYYYSKDEEEEQETSDEESYSEEEDEVVSNEEGDQIVSDKM